MELRSIRAACAAAAAGRDRSCYIFGQISNKIPLKLQYKNKNINKQLKKNEIGKKIKIIFFILYSCTYTMSKR